MIKSEKQALKQIIKQELKELRELLSLSSSSAKTVELDQTSTGRVSRIDAIQQQKMAINSLRRDSEREQKLIRVLSFIDDKQFGICEECDQPIAFKRLQIKPESRFCIGCQTLLE
jgi:DnaK suppressor protein